MSDFIKSFEISLFYGLIVRDMTGNQLSMMFHFEWLSMNKGESCWISRSMDEKDTPFIFSLFFIWYRKKKDLRIIFFFIKRNILCQFDRFVLKLIRTMSMMSRIFSEVRNKHSLTKINFLLSLQTVKQRRWLFAFFVHWSSLS